MKILVIGAAGYVGSRLIHDFTYAGHEVTAAVHSAHGAAALRRNFQGPVLIGDITDPRYRNELLNGLNGPTTPEAGTVKNSSSPSTFTSSTTSNFNAIFYLASLNYQNFVGVTEAALNIKVKAYWHLLDALHHEARCTIVYFSTQQVYGPFGSSTAEDKRPNPANLYALSHRLGEEVGAYFHRTSPHKVISLRLANVVGAPGFYREEFLRFAVTDLCKQALTKGKICLRSDPNLGRDFVPLSEVSAAARFLLGQPKEKLMDGIFNVGSGNETTLRQVAEMVARLVSASYSVPVHIEFKSTEEIAPMGPPSLPTANKLTPGSAANEPRRLQLLGFQAHSGLESAIQETIAFLKLNPLALKS